MKLAIQAFTAMIQCQNCGQSNTDTSQFCRFCGTKFLARHEMPQENYNYGSPRPYSWKTDEYQTQSEPRPLEDFPNPELPAPHNQALNQNYGGHPLVYNAPQYMAGNYRCPNCGTQYLPIIERRISTAGWITFSLLLVFTFIFFWIGLLIKEEVRICPVCKIKVG